MTVQINGDTGVSLVQDNTIQTADIVNGAVTADKLASGVTGTAAPQKMMLMSAKATTSGTAVDFSPADGTGIPSWAKKITVMFSGVSTNGASITQIQLGSGAVQNSGYQAGAIRNVSNAANQAGATSGFILTAAQSAADLFGGSMIISLLGSSTWVAQFALGYSSSYASTGGGSVTLTGTLDRIRLTTVNGTDTFDAGSISLLIEG